MSATGAILLVTAFLPLWNFCKFHFSAPVPRRPGHMYPTAPPSLRLWVKQPLAKFATGQNLSQIVDASPCIQCKRTFAAIQAVAKR